MLNLHPQPPAPHGVDPRLATAEAVATAALAFVQTYGAWAALHLVALAIESRDHPERVQVLQDLLGDGPGNMETQQAIAAFERLDACVRAWTPHAYA